MSTFSKAFFSLNSESINITWTQLAVLYIYYFNLQTVLSYTCHNLPGTVSARSQETCVAKE